MTVIWRRRMDAASDGEGHIPGRGEAIRWDIPDTMKGIRFEIGKMVGYVRHFSTHPLVLRTARRVVELCEAKDKTCEMNSLFLWTKGNFRYVNDPPNREVIQTPVSQIADIMTPPQVLEAVLGPALVKQLSGFGVGHSLLDATRDGRSVIACRSCFSSHLDGPHPKTSGDCDEGASFLATMLAAVGIPSRFRFGGQEMADGSCGYHHVWVQGQNDGGEWVDMDITEKKSKLGWFYESFGCFGHTSIF